MTDTTRRTGAREAVIEALVGVYHAYGSPRGELASLVAKLTGRSHCALCDVTHGLVRRRRSFDACMATLPVPFELVHLDERTPDDAAASEGRTPCVLVRAGGRVVLLLDADQIAACDGDPERLRAAIDEAATTLGLSWPAQPVTS